MSQPSPGPTSPGAIYEPKTKGKNRMELESDKEEGKEITSKTKEEAPVIKVKCSNGTPRVSQLQEKKMDAGW